MEYSKITVIDMCEFLNGGVDLLGITKKHFKGFDHHSFLKTQMYDFLKFKSDNFDKYKFQLVFDEISEFVFSYMGFYRLVRVNNEFVFEWARDIEQDNDFTDKEPLKFIFRTIELNEGLRVKSQRIIEFIEIAENLYQSICLDTQQQINTETLLFQTDSKLDNTKPQKANTLSDLITHSKGIEIVEGIKIQYKNIKGKRLKLLLMALQELGLFPKEGNASKFHTLCKSEFDWDIASYQAMNDYKFNDVTDKPELCEMKQYLENLINPK